MAKLQKQESNFTQVSNLVLCDKNLSAKAKGIYAYLYCKPDDWQFASERIAKEFSDGIRAIQTGLQELEKFGYLQRKRYGDGSVEYFLYIDPKVENSILDADPKVENRRMLKQQNAKTAEINNIDNNTNTEIYSNTEVETEKIEKKKNSITIEDLSFIPNKNIKDGIVEFFQYRKSIRKPIKKESLPAFFRQLQKLSGGDEKLHWKFLNNRLRMVGNEFFHSKITNFLKI